MAQVFARESFVLTKAAQGTREESSTAKTNPQDAEQSAGAVAISASEEASSLLQTCTTESVETFNDAVLVRKLVFCDFEGNDKYGCSACACHSAARLNQPQTISRASFASTLGKTQR